MDAKGCGMDAKNCGVDAKGYSVDAEGYGVAVGRSCRGISCFLMQTVLQGSTLVGGIYLVWHNLMPSDKLIAVMFYQSQVRR